MIKRIDAFQRRLANLDTGFFRMLKAMTWAEGISKTYKKDLKATGLIEGPQIDPFVSLLFQRKDNPKAAEEIAALGKQMSDLSLREKGLPEEIKLSEEAYHSLTDKGRENPIAAYKTLARILIKEDENRAVGGHSPENKRGKLETTSKLKTILGAIVVALVIVLGFKTCTSGSDPSIISPGGTIVEDTELGTVEEPRRWVVIHHKNPWNEITFVRHTHE
ncbi:MAG: hypothetical protein AAGJ85_07550, partial [Pseudomonadota bacterium]